MAESRLGLRWQLQKVAGEQCGVHRARPKSLDVYSYVKKAECLENAGKLRKHFHGQRPGEFFAGNFNPDYFAVMAYAALVKAECAQSFLTALHGHQSLWRDRTPILDAGREAGGCRLVPDPQSGLLGEFTDLSLGEPSLEQGGSHVMPDCGLLPGTKVTLIVYIYAVSDGGESMRLRK